MLAYDDILDDEYLIHISTLPAPLKFAHIIYQEMKRRSELETITIPLISDSVDALVFRGNMGELFKESGASNSYYSEIRKTLINCGSIHILERGTIHSPSVVVVSDKLPPMDAIERANVKSQVEVLTTAHPSYTMIVDRVEAIERRLPEINLTEALTEIEKRLAKLEGNTD